MNNYGYLKKVGFLYLMLAVIAGCTTHNKQVPSEKPSMLQKIYIDAVDSKNVILVDEALEVKITGNLPSPAYTFERFDIQVKGNVIEILPLAKHDTDKIVIQVLVPFEEICRIDNLKPGNYEIKVKGRGDSEISKTNIQVKK